MTRVPSSRSPRWIAAALVAAATSTMLVAREPITRKTYITVVDNQGQAVTGLTAADFTVRENGRDREVASLTPATEKLRIALAVEEQLAATTGARQGLVEFVQKMAPQAEISLVIVGLTNRVAVPYTSDVNTLVGGINGLPLNVPRQASQLAEGVSQLARTFAKEKPVRPAIVLLALESQQPSNDRPQEILNYLRQGNAQMHVVSVATRSGTAPRADRSGEDMSETNVTAQVLDEGPKQSGGRQWPVTALTAIPKAMMSIAGELSSQYLLTYTLPDGVKPSDRLAVATKRRGVTLRAATRISDQ